MEVGVAIQRAANVAVPEFLSTPLPEHLLCHA
jgi:hypothetical protein